MAEETFPTGALMAGKRGLVMGVANKNSIAWGVAQQLAAQGAELAFSYQDPALEKRVRPLVESLGGDPFMVIADVTDDASMDACFATLKEKWGRLDFLVHAIAFAGKEELQGSFTHNTTREGFKRAMDISAFSFVDASRRASELMPSKEDGGGAIVHDIRSSRAVAEHIRANGGEPVLCRVGHSFMKAKLRETGGPFGGELAGHFYFREFAYADSAFLTMITVMNIIDAAGKPLSELIAPFKTYTPSGEINFETEKGDKFIEDAPEKFPGGEALTIDGVRIDFPDWWFSLRKSNTEPLLRLVVEGDTREVMEAKVEAIKSWLMSEGAKLH